ncbi:MAG TPA: hypothetical protein VF198_07140, partial [Vicinamibacterales bacterium]
EPDDLVADSANPGSRGQCSGGGTGPTPEKFGFTYLVIFQLFNHAGTPHFRLTFSRHAPRMSRNRWPCRPVHLLQSEEPHAA